MPPTPSPTQSKSNKIDPKGNTAYHLFWCGKSTKATGSPTRAPTKGPTAGKSVKCKSQTATLNVVEQEGVEATDSYEIVETPEVTQTTVNGEVYFVPSSTVDQGTETCAVTADASATGTTVDVPIKYYAVTNNGTDPFSALDYTMADYVSSIMFTCGNNTQEPARRTLSTTPLRTIGGRALADGEEITDCVGVNSNPGETVISKEGCPDSINTSEDEVCSVLEGGVTLVLHDSSTNQDAASKKATNAINNAFENGVFTNADSAYNVAGIVSLKMTDSSDDTAAAATPGEIKGAQAATTTLSSVGAAMLSLGLIAFIALVLMALRIKRKRDRTYDEFWEDDNDLAAKDTGSTDDSFIDSDDILRDLAFNNQVDVHHCTSATCQICAGRQTIFIDTGDNDTISEVYPYEFETANERNKSFEYIAKPEASSPRFDNPANIRPRLYEVEDTVHL